MARPKRRTPLEQFYFSGIPLPESSTELCTASTIPIPERVLQDEKKKQLWDFIVADMENRRCLSATYTLLISELVEVIMLMHQCRTAMDKDGLIVNKYDDEGNFITSLPNPHYTILSRQQPMLIKLLEKIGMSPRDITYLVNPEATATQQIEERKSEFTGIQYFR